MSKQTLLMVWKPEQKQDYDHKVVYVDFAHMSEDSKIKYHVYGCYGEENMGLADLRIRAQANIRDAKPALYGYSVEYYPYCVDWHRAKIMVATLATLHKKLEKIEKEWGSALTFGAYVQRIGKAFGVKALIHYTRNPGLGAWNDRGEYVTNAWKDAATTIDWLVGRELNPNQETVAA